MEGSIYPILYLAGSLATHRRSRILVQLLDAELAGDLLPEKGMCLMFGQEYQQAKHEKQKKWQEWCKQPGRTLLLIPPFQAGQVGEGVDWSLAFSGDDLKAEKNSVAQMVASEVTFLLQSKFPVFDRTPGHHLNHQWTDYTFNTLFNKRHSGSGVFCATTLPLWSISLMDAGDKLRKWLGRLHEHAGNASESKGGVEDKAVFNILEPQDYSVLSCVYAWQTTTPKALAEKLGSQIVPLFSFDLDWLTTSYNRLEKAGALQKGALTELGLAQLQECPWWGHAQQMKEVS
jgi:hypothetical protein